MASSAQYNADAPYGVLPNGEWRSAPTSTSAPRSGLSSTVRKVGNHLKTNWFRYVVLVVIVILVIWLIVESTKSGLQSGVQRGGSTNPLGVQLTGGSGSSTGPNAISSTKAISALDAAAVAADPHGVGGCAPPTGAEAADLQNLVGELEILGATSSAGFPMNERSLVAALNGQ